MIDNGLTGIEEQLEEQDLDLAYNTQFELYKLEWLTETPLENCRDIREDFDQVDFYHFGDTVPTVEDANDVWMRKEQNGKMEHYFSYKEEIGRATVAVHNGEVLPFVNMVADFEQWDELSDKRDQLYILLSEASFE